jgi:GPH family glycoside/pentoside/hexuronide:cation symporter
MATTPPEHTKGLPAEAATPPPERSGKLGFFEKFGVGTGGLTVSLGNQSVRTTGQGVLNMILGINAFWVGVVLAIPLLWDAITDPIMGNLSDNFKSRFGRRRPFIFGGAVLMGLSFASIWLIPVGWSDGGKLAWFLITSLLFYTSYTIFSVPFIALTYEMTPDYDERTAVQGFVTFWNRLGEMTYMGLIPLSLTFIAWKYGYADTADLTNPEKLEGIRISAAVYGGVGMTLFGLLPAFFSKERLYKVNVREQKGKKDPFWASARLTLQNKAFAILCLLAVFTIIAGVFAANMDWYLLIFYLSDGDVALGTQWKLIVTVGYALVGILGIPLIVWLTGKMSKIQGFMFIYCMMILNAGMRWFVYRPGRFDDPLGWSSIDSIVASFASIFTSLIWLDPMTGGLFWIGVGVLGQSMIADVCDDDELKNGHRREGMFGAIYGWSMKASFALSFVLIGIFLEGIGFDPQWGSTRWLQVEASAKNYAPATFDFSIIDDESESLTAAASSVATSPMTPGPNTLTIQLESNRINESDGRIKAILSRPGTTGELRVNLKSDKAFLLQCPSSVIIPDGSSTAEAGVEIVDDQKVRGEQKVTITAWTEGGRPSRSTAVIMDNDGPAMSLKAQQTEMTENGGQIELTLSRHNGNLSHQEVSLSLLSKVKGKESDAVIPLSVTLPEGEDQVTFTVSAIDNDVVDGQQSNQTFFRMRIAMCAGAALPALLCFILLAFYPLTKEKSENNRRALEAKRGQV